MSVDHYENFPVASLLMPGHLRPAVKNIYRFARSADDIADEGTATPEERLAQLSAYRQALATIDTGDTRVEQHGPLHRIFDPLAATISQHRLPMEPFLDLISAFEQDVIKARYDSDDELLDYCRRSANPVGRLMLHLYDTVNDRNLRDADAICTGLQLTNFWQDVAIDWTKGRVYLPLDKLERHGITLDYIARNVAAVSSKNQGAAAAPSANSMEARGSGQQAAWARLMQEQVQQAREMLLSGLPLTSRIPGRVGFELKLVVHGGLRILERLDQLHYDIFLFRPTLTRGDWMLLLWRALR